MMMRLLLLVLLVAVTMAAPTDQKDGNDGDVMNMIQDMQNKIATLEANDKKAEKERVDFSQKLQTEIAELKKDKEGLRHEIQNLQNERQINGQTMFLATISVEELPSADDEPIIWDSAPINPGGHFSTETGGYTAPSNGYYQFSVTKSGGDSSASFYFLVDETRYSVMWLFIDGGTTEPGTSATITVELTAGQVVRVENDGSSYVIGTRNGYMHSWFTGHLLYAL